MLLILLAIYATGVTVAAFLAGFLNVKLDGMPVGVFALFWPLVLPLAALDFCADGLARIGRRARGDE